MEILPAAEQQGQIFVFCGGFLFLPPEGLVPGECCVSVLGEGSAGTALTAAHVSAEMGRQVNNLLRKKRTRTAKGPLRVIEASRKAKLWKLFGCTGSETSLPAQRQFLQVTLDRADPRIAALIKENLSFPKDEKEADALRSLSATKKAKRCLHAAVASRGTNL